MGKSYKHERTEFVTTPYRRPAPGAMAWEVDEVDDDLTITPARSDAPEGVYTSCAHLGALSTNRFGFIHCDECHENMGWHPSLVREGLYGGAPCVHQSGDCPLDCGTREWVATMREVHMSTDEGRALLAFGAKFIG